MQTGRRTSEEHSRAWDAIAEDFDRRVTPSTVVVGQQLVERLRLSPGSRVLDVGAGTGAVAVPAARRGATVIAVDVSPEMVAGLRRRALAAGLDGLDARVGDATALDLPDDAVDVTVSLNGLSLVPDLARALREAVRVTRPGGRVAVATFGPVSDVEMVAFLLAAVRAVAPGALPPSTAPLPPFRLADRRDLQAALEEAGLRDVGVTPMTWELTVRSGAHLLEVLLASNPAPGAILSGLTDEEVAEVRGLLHGMVRDRAAGAGEALLTAALLVGVGVV